MDWQRCRPSLVTRWQVIRVAVRFEYFNCIFNAVKVILTEPVCAKAERIDRVFAVGIISPYPILWNQWINHIESHLLVKIGFAKVVYNSEVSFINSDNSVIATDRQRLLTTFAK